MKNGLLSLAYLFATGAILLLTPVAHAAVVISDTFSDDGALNGTTPDETVGGATWQSAGGGSASGGVYNVTTAGSQTSVIDLGANYFSNNPGVYALSMTVTMPTATTSTSWIGLGFVSNPVLSGHMAVNASSEGLQGTTGNNGGQPWMFLRQNGGLNVYRGPGTTNPASTISTTYAAGTAYNLSLVLNTTGTNWTLDAFVDGVQLDLNGAGTAGNSSIFASNPTDIRYVGFSQNGGSFGSITIDNFTLSVVPEPGSAILLAGAGLVLLGVRRRRAPDAA